MSAALMERAAADAQIALSEKLAFQAEQASLLHLLTPGEIFYFSPMAGETAREALVRVRPLIQDCAKKHGCRLLTKLNGDAVRVRMMPLDGATGRLAEWHNLLPGHSVNVHEHLSESELAEAVKGAYQIANRLSANGKGHFVIEAHEFFPIGNCVRITRQSQAERLWPGYSRDLRKTYPFERRVGVQPTERDGI